MRASQLWRGQYAVKHVRGMDRLTVHDGINELLLILHRHPHKAASMTIANIISLRTILAT
jgi:hypothetical protein